MLVPVPEIRALITLMEKMCWCVINPVVYNGQHKKFYNSFSFIFFLSFLLNLRKIYWGTELFIIVLLLYSKLLTPPQKNPKQPKKPKQTHLNYLLFIHSWHQNIQLILISKEFYFEKMCVVFFFKMMFGVGVY